MTALEQKWAAAEAADPNIIPPMTDPMGKHWDQPAREEILIDDTHALMSGSTFAALHEYSCSVPTGCYPGKMWRCHVGIYDPRCKPEDRYWILRWFGFSSKGAAYCSNNVRRIVIL